MLNGRRSQRGVEKGLVFATAKFSQVAIQSSLQNCTSPIYSLLKSDVTYQKLKILFLKNIFNALTTINLEKALIKTWEGIFKPVF